MKKKGNDDEKEVEIEWLSIQDGTWWNFHELLINEYESNIWPIIK